MDTKQILVPLATLLAGFSVSQAVDISKMVDASKAKVYQATFFSSADGMKVNMIGAYSDDTGNMKYLPAAAVPSADVIKCVQNYIDNDGLSTWKKLNGL